MNPTTESLGKYISILYRSGAMYFNHNFQDCNIGSGQYPFIIFLSRNEGVTQEEMSSSLYIDKGTTAKAVKKMEQAGYVRREVDEKDKRAYRVYLTEEGRNITMEIFKVLHSWNDILTSDFTEEEKKLALNLLQRMVGNKNKELKKENGHDR
jgi:DNA-binding MarR family transcriptional regulator